MITEKELCKAIEECQEEPITGTKRSALADLFIIYDHLFGKPDFSGYSYDYKPENTIYTDGGTDFLQIVNGKDTEKVFNRETIRNLKNTETDLQTTHIT